MSDTVRTEVSGAIYHVIMARAEKRNALHFDMVTDIARAIRDTDKHPNVRAVILSGDGPIFSAGIDLMTLMHGRTEIGETDVGRWTRRMADRFQDCLHVIESTELPIIAAIHGKVMGLGMELALACDLRVCTEDAEMSIPEAKMGLVADVGGTTRLCRTVGSARAKDMLMTARAIGAEEALSWGLVNRVCATGKHMECATEFANEIAKNAPLAVGLAKLIVDQGSGTPKHTQLAIERWAQSLLMPTEDVVEAATAFMERRPAEFKGK